MSFSETAAVGVVGEYSGRDMLVGALAASARAAAVAAAAAAAAPGGVVEVLAVGVAGGVAGGVAAVVTTAMVAPPSWAVCRRYLLRMGLLTRSLVGTGVTPAGRLATVTAVTPGGDATAERACVACCCAALV